VSNIQTFSYEDSPFLSLFQINKIIVRIVYILQITVNSAYNELLRTMRNSSLYPEFLINVYRTGFL